MEYVYSTYLLEQAARQGARVVNDPRAVRDHNEKYSITEFPTLTTDVLVSRDPLRLRAFVAEHGEAVLKLLDGMGGASIFRVRPDDPNLSVILETMNRFGGRTVMAQRYLPAIARRRQAHPADRRRGRPVLRSRAFRRAASRAATSPPAAPAGRSRCRRAIARSPSRSRRSCSSRGLFLVGPRRDRRRPDRDQRHQPDLLSRDRGPDRLRRRRPVHRPARAAGGARLHRDRVTAA